ncbi:hypothetical protein CEXT_613411 [Caerostris extrusa]|uniref:Uncharacterized protein n=1 Tax=Caerostris extrusa TaxID=172846 RepID=A0AAV4R8F7_CAEEX|nr:hypothetical protein CEXT_613411 [Caerostris extrusa]
MSPMDGLGRTNSYYTGAVGCCLMVGQPFSKRRARDSLNQGVVPRGRYDAAIRKKAMHAQHDDQKNVVIIVGESNFVYASSSENHLYRSCKRPDLKISLSLPDFPLRGDPHVGAVQRITLLWAPTCCVERRPFKCC